MEGKFKFNIPQQSIIYIIMCMAGVLIFLFVGIIPYQNTLKNLDMEIQRNELQVQQQKTLQPLYRTLLKQVNRQDDRLLPMPDIQPMPKGQLGRAPAILRGIAVDSGMDMMSVSPELNALTVDAKRIPVNAVLRGSFLDLRRLLINLGRLPYVENVEQIQIVQIADMLEFRIRIWLAIG